jgi:hypothetical protein
MKNIKHFYFFHPYLIMFILHQKNKGFSMNNPVTGGEI